MKHNWALVLSGGGARGLAHVGFLKGMEDAGFPKPSLVAGTSMGAIVGGLYACGMSPGEMVRFVIDEFKIGDYFESFAFKLNGPVGQIFQTAQTLASLATSTGVDKGQKALDLFIARTGGKTFKETDIPFRCNAVDLLSGREVVFSSGSVAKAMRASMSFPVFFEPFYDKGMCLVDGGLFNNMPVAIARKEGFRHVLAVNVNSFARVKAEELKNGPQIIIRTIESVLYNLNKEKMDKADLTIDVLDDATPFSFDRKNELISLGENTVRENLEQLTKFFKSRSGLF